MMCRRFAIILGITGLLLCPTIVIQYAPGTSGSASAATRAAPPDPRTDPECERRFQAMFGAEAVKVDASVPKTDDADFAEKLAAAASQAEGDTTFQVYLYDKVCIFGLRHTRTLALVRGALVKLDALAPAQRPVWEEHRLELRRQLYRQAPMANRAAFGEDLITQLIVVGDLRGQAGKWDEAADLFQQAYQTASSHRSPQKDAASEKLNQANRMKEVQALRKQLEQNPGNATLRMSVIDGYLGVLDDPAAAVELLTPDVSEAYRTYVPLAARPTHQLAAGPLLELADWYKSLARRATATARITFVNRTKDYYVAYIQAVRKEGITVSALQEALKKINAGLREVSLPRIDRLFFRDPAVEEAYEKALDWLWKAQRSDGAWMSGSYYSSPDYAGMYGTSYYYGDYNTSTTAAALAVLLANGASIDDPRLAKTIRWLEPTVTTRTCGIAFRCLAWVEVQKQKPGRAGAMLANDIVALLRATRTGGYGSSVTSWDYPRYRQSWLAPVGIEAADQTKPVDRRAYWQQVVSYWTSLQRTDGSISPSGKKDTQRAGQMPTIIGAGTMAIAMSKLHGTEAVKKLDAKCEPLARAIAWLDENLNNPSDLTREITSDSSGSGTSDGTYYGSSYVTNALCESSYMLSRLALATGREKFGKLHWWNDASSLLVDKQRGDGSWGNAADTATVLLFLANGYKFEQTCQGDLPSLMPRSAPKSPTTKPAKEKKLPAKPKQPFTDSGGPY